MKIHKIYTMEGEYENAEFYGERYDFITAIEESKVIRIIENNQKIYINSNYIISFEL